MINTTVFSSYADDKNARSQPVVSYELSVLRITVSSTSLNVLINGNIELKNVIFLFHHTTYNKTKLITYIRNSIVEISFTLCSVELRHLLIRDQSAYICGHN